VREKMTLNELKMTNLYDALKRVEKANQEIAKAEIEIRNTLDSLKATTTKEQFRVIYNDFREMRDAIRNEI